MSDAFELALVGVTWCGGCLLGSYFTEHAGFSVALILWAIVALISGSYLVGKREQADLRRKERKEQ